MTIGLADRPLGIVPVLVFEAVYRNVCCILSDILLQICLIAVRTITIRHVPAVSKCTYIAGLNHIILCGISTRIQSKIIPHQILVVPLVQKLDRFLCSILRKKTIVKALYIVFLVRNVGIQAASNQHCCSPAYIIADRERNHLICILSKKDIRIIAESNQRLIEFFRCCRYLKIKLLQPVLTNKGKLTVIDRHFAFQGPQGACGRILIPIYIGFSQPVPHVGKISFILLNRFAEVCNSAHIRIGLNGCIIIGIANIRCGARCQKVIDLLRLIGSRNRYKLNVNIVLLQHLILDVLIKFVGLMRSFTALRSIIPDLNRNVLRLCKLPVCQFRGALRSFCNSFPGFISGT